MRVMSMWVSEKASLMRVREFARTCACGSATAPDPQTPTARSPVERKGCELAMSRSEGVDVFDHVDLVDSRGFTKSYETHRQSQGASAVLENASEAFFFG